MADFYLIESLKAAVEDAVRKVKISEANFEEVSLCAVDMGGGGNFISIGFFP